MIMSMNCACDYDKYQRLQVRQGQKRSYVQASHTVHEWCSTQVGHMVIALFRRVVHLPVRDEDVDFNADAYACVVDES